MWNERSQSSYLSRFSVLSIVWRRRPAAGGVLPGRRQPEPAGERLFPALQTGVQPELPGGWLPLSVPVERRRLAGGKLRELWMLLERSAVSCVLKQNVLPLCLSLRPSVCLWRGEGEFALSCLLKCESLPLSEEARGEERSCWAALMKIRWSAFFHESRSLVVKWKSTALMLIG